MNNRSRRLGVSRQWQHGTTLEAEGISGLEAAEEMEGENAEKNTTGFKTTEQIKNMEKVPNWIDVLNSFRDSLG